jgi:hypothetical protein
MYMHLHYTNGWIENKYSTELSNYSGSNNNITMVKIRIEENKEGKWLTLVHYY